MVKSDDGGDTWKSLSQQIYTLSDGICYDAIISADDPNQILAAVYGIMRSENNGQSWRNVFSHATIYTLTHSARDPQVVYAGGRNPTGTLFFAASADFGDTWKTIDMVDSPTGIGVNDMVSVMEGGREMLYFGTNKGVYSYRFEK